MTADRVLGLLELLTGVDIWVDGGWGVDALVGEQTREHGDLDLGVARTELATVLEVLASAGYVVSDDRFAEVTVQLTHTEQIDFDGETLPQRAKAVPKTSRLMQMFA